MFWRGQWAGGTVPECGTAGCDLSAYRAQEADCSSSRLLSFFSNNKYFKKIILDFFLYRTIRIFFLNSQVWGTRKNFLLVNNIAGLGGVGWVVLAEADVSLAEISD